METPGWDQSTPSMTERHSNHEIDAAQANGDGYRKLSISQLLLEPTRAPRSQPSGLLQHRPPSKKGGYNQQ